MHRLIAILVAASMAGIGARAAERKTTVSIVGDAFHINGAPTYAGREWRGHRVEGLLMNSRMVQGIFDDRNPETISKWAYADTGKWDPERNTREFIAAMPEWRKHGLLAFTINFQGGSPEGYSSSQPWENSAFAPDGSLRAEYCARLGRILDRADELGMVAIVGYFYFGQDERLRDEAAVIRATDEATKWLLDGGWRNVLVEVNNESNVRYDHAILKPERVHELIDRIRKSEHDGRRLLVSTSYGGGTVPHENVVRASDFLLLHGNGVKDPKRIAEMVRKTRVVAGYTPKPILFNEDDHFDFEKPENNFIVSVAERASWGYFDFRMKGEGADEGYQSVPVNWGLSSERKRTFSACSPRLPGQNNLAGTSACVAAELDQGSRSTLARVPMVPHFPAMTNAQKRELKARAQLLEPVVKLGHAGMSDAFLASLDTALSLHGLVKMKFTDFKEQKHELVPQIAEKTGSTLVMQVGNVAVFFREKTEKEPGSKQS